MQLLSINGELQPLVGTPSFLAYYVVVSYDQVVGAQTAFQSQTLICEADGTFRFFLPDGDVVDDIALVEVHAPDGTQLHSAHYSVTSMAPSLTPDNVDDTTPAFVIVVDAQEVQLETSPNSDNRLKGKVIDILGGKIPANLQVIVWATTDPAQTTFDPNLFEPILVDQTDSRGYFSGGYEPDAYEVLFATVGGAIGFPVPIALENGEVPRYVILPLEFEQIQPDAGCGCGDSSLARLPDSDDLTSGEGHFSNDLGGSCNVQFKPNRTLEEFDYCTVVRTTEPQIRRHTVTEAQLYKVKGRLRDISRHLKKSLEGLKGQLEGTRVKSTVVEAFADQDDDSVLLEAQKTIVR